MVTISGGYLKKSNLIVPKGIEPAKSIVKQSIFNYLNDYFIQTSDAKVKEAHEGIAVLDLFAGSGNLGIEAISRGAGYAVLVEQDYKNYKIIQENIVKLNIEEKCEVIHLDALKFIGQASEVYDIIFADPPYNLPNKHFLKTVHLVVKPKTGILVYLHSSNNLAKEVENMKFIETREFGKSGYSVYKRI